MSFTITLHGMDDVIKKLDGLADTTKVKQAVRAGALMVESDAKLSIMHGSHNGRTYGHHTASAPGEAPATDTGMLVSSIHTEVSDDGLSASVGSNLEYANDLEYGTRKMAARPFIEPALDKNHDAIVERIAKAVGSSI